MQSAIYEGMVRHTRRVAPPHGFTKRLFMVYLDLAELDRVFAGRWLWGVERRRFVSFRRADHLGDPAVPLDRSIRALIQERTGRVVQGPIRTLTQLRTAGYVFNPVIFHYAFTPAGDLEAVVADVSNTPWNERHCYVLAAQSGRIDAHAEKVFHVSPFLSMEHEYRFRFDAPEADLMASIEAFACGERVFDARLELVRREIDGPTLARTLARFPLMTAQVIGGIYWQALRLHRLGAPFHPHPAASAPTEMRA
ncbi:DUF1365 domain-containing protein [Myxococcota bacterium]|nr:DUF1365 domain-containing protein [Myxococcota bacterium]